MVQLSEVRKKVSPQIKKINTICFFANIVIGVWVVATEISETTYL